MSIQSTRTPYTVWESTSDPSSGKTVESSTPRQAAFLFASTSEIGYRTADLIVSDGTRSWPFHVVPHVWYTAEQEGDDEVEGAPECAPVEAS